MLCNPLLADVGSPIFAAVRAEHIVPAIEAAIAAHSDTMGVIAAEPVPTFEAVFLAKEHADATLDWGWSIASHLRAVIDTPELRAACQKAEALLTTYKTQLGQNAQLFGALESVLLGYDDLPAEGRRALELTLRDFRLSGILLDEPTRSHFRDIQIELARLQTEFNNAVLDASQSWMRRVEDRKLQGLPDTEKAMLAAAARDRGVEGWLATLQAPVVNAILTYADDRDLRAEVYRAYVTRASDQASGGESFDNSGRMARILALRREAACLLGFDTPVDHSLSTKMASSAEEVLAFLHELAGHARPIAERELTELRQRAAEIGIDNLQPWDVAYLSEKLSSEECGIDHSVLRQYFTLPTVLDGLFSLIENLFGVAVVVARRPDMWHEDVQCLELRNDQGQVVAAIYCDFFSRLGKQGGAWMDVCRPRLRDEEQEQVPIAYLTCNFASPGAGVTATLTHRDVVTLFHEMGHCLHHVLSRVEIPSVGGISHVEWDAVELPSQLLENFAWQPDVLRSISAHVDNGAPLPSEMIDRLVVSRHFQSGLATLRQIELASFDIQLHLAAESDPEDIVRLLEKVRADLSPMPYPSWNRTAHAFTHIFSGGYGAGYYSYLWAERLAADAFDCFVDGEAPNRDVGRNLRDNILAVGSTRPAIESFVAFRGRQPSSEALLRQRGLVA
jgi:oligopeptidase A